jgi:hypothetical protein
MSEDTRSHAQQPAAQPEAEYVKKVCKALRSGHPYSGIVNEVETAAADLIETLYLASLGSRSPAASSDQFMADYISDTERGIAEKLQNPAAVHLNMLTGAIAKPSLANIKHLYPEVQQAFDLVESSATRVAVLEAEIQNALDCLCGDYPSMAARLKATLSPSSTVRTPGDAA